MKCHAFEVEQSNTLKAVDPDHALSRVGKGDGRFWFDLTNYTASELAGWLESLDLPGFVKRLCVEEATPPRMISLPHYAFIEVLVFPDSAGSQSDKVGVLATETLLVTFHSRPLDVGTRAQDILEQADADDLSSSRLLLLLLLLHVERTKSVANAQVRSQSDMDDRLDAAPLSVAFEEIRVQKQAVARLAAVAESQTECLEFLSQSESDSLSFSRHAGNVGQLVLAARSMRQTADRLKNAANDTRRHYEALQAQKISHRLNILTVVTAVFIPLTFLAGIWGMNFETMPELSWTYGYPLALGLMAVIAGTLMWYFKRAGWFD